MFEDSLMGSGPVNKITLSSQNLSSLNKPVLVARSAPLVVNDSGSFDDLLGSRDED